MEMQKKLSERATKERDGSESREDSVWPKDLLPQGMKQAEFLCEVTGARYLPKSEKRGELFVIEVRVVDGPNPAVIGCLTPGLFVKRPLGNKYKTWQDENNPKKKFTAEQKENADDERIQLAVAACFGLDGKSAGELAEGGSHEGACEKIFASYFTNGGASDDPTAIVGRKVINRVFTNSKGFVNNELKPHNVTNETFVGKSGSSKAAPSLPGKPTKLTLKQAMAKHGFEIHPDDDSFVFNGDEVISVDDFKAKFSID